MSAKFDLNDNGVVVVIGSGAGGGATVWATDRCLEIDRVLVRGIIEIWPKLFAR